jgi:hypothetical protein
MTLIAMVSNTVDSHFDTLKRLFESSADRVVIASPFLAEDIQGLLQEFSFESVRTLELVTTFKPCDPEQLTKPGVLKSFFDYLKSKYPRLKVKLHVDNQLHGKV